MTRGHRTGASELLLAGLLLLFFPGSAGGASPATDAALAAQEVADEH